MSEQSIILIFLVLSIGATLGLYMLKAVKQVKYRGDERWSLIQLKSNNAANITNWILLILLSYCTIFGDGQITLTLQRVTILGFIYIGARNLTELISIIYFDKQF